MVSISFHIVFLCSDSGQGRYQMNRLFIVMASIFLVLFLIACGSESGGAEKRDAPSQKPSLGSGEMPTTPEATVARLLELAEAGEWETYVDDYYGETHKFKDEGERDLLVSRFRDDWGEVVIESLRQVKDLEPKISVDGRNAVFELGDNGKFTLYKDDEGRWKFHL